LQEYPPLLLLGQGPMVIEWLRPKPFLGNLVSNQNQHH
jgi:hypothetical protein